MSADDKCPPWVRLSTSDMTSMAGRYILGGKGPKEWADYGRYIGLMQLMARTEEGYVDISDPRRLRSLSQDLGMTPKACREWIEMLIEGGAVERESYEQCGWVCVADVYNAVQSYRTKCRINKRNAAGAATPKKKADDAPDG